MLAESAARHGAHAAVTQGDDIQLTYVEVLGRAVSLAAWLQHEVGRCHLIRGDATEALDAATAGLDAAELAENREWRLYLTILKAQAQGGACVYAEKERGRGGERSRD